jgi:hypothetical protein
LQTQYGAHISTFGSRKGKMCTQVLVFQIREAVLRTLQQCSSQVPVPEWSQMSYLTQSLTEEMRPTGWAKVCLSRNTGRVGMEHEGSEIDLVCSKECRSSGFLPQSNCGGKAYVEKQKLSKQGGK